MTLPIMSKARIMAIKAKSGLRSNVNNFFIKKTPHFSSFIGTGAFIFSYLFKV
ncbi:hypothetical protein GCM10009001_32840 [Virgibacillus siamensis]|uniref:Uncharacterized protein n=1 Tax=Virgibacillus siamensis TaxID=480071 RepID=A0ABN1GJT8_9BACI